MVVSSASLMIHSDNNIKYINIVNIIYINIINKLHKNFENFFKNVV